MTAKSEVWPASSPSSAPGPGDLAIFDSRHIVLMSWNMKTATVVGGVEGQPVSAGNGYDAVATLHHLKSATRFLGSVTLSNE